MKTGTNDSKVAFLVVSMSSKSMSVAIFLIRGTSGYESKFSLSLNISVMSSSAWTPYSMSSRNRSICSNTMF